jgi:probable rRNA maturation factor
MTPVALDVAGERLEAAGVPVTVSARGRRHTQVSPATIRRRAQRMLQALTMTDAELSVVLCDDVVMRALNRRYRKRDRTTDVLAFAMSEGLRMPAVAAAPLGDVVISVPTAARQARATGKRPLDEITMLLAHGLLHLLGFDHRTQAEERRMRARTDALVGAALRP